MRIKWWHIALIVCLAVVFLSPLASSSPDGLERVAEDHEFVEQSREAPFQIIADYLFPGQPEALDYLETLPQVDKNRIGCAGLSLGGEMTMWLGALDPRLAAIVSAGFLTYMDQLEQNHCMCWKFPHLRDLVDFPDIYSLIAPRPLQCQNGLKEPPSQFCVSLAREVMKEIEVIYSDLRLPDHVVLDVHGGGHEINLPILLEFLRKHLANAANGSGRKSGH